MSPPFLVKPVFLDRLFFIYERRSSAWPRVAAFFSKACLFRQAFFYILAGPFGVPSGRRLFFENPSLKNEWFFNFLMIGVVRLCVGCSSSLVQNVILIDLIY